MHRTSRRVVILVVAVAALGYFVYKFRNSITLEGFHWSTVGQSLREANLGLLLLALVTIYGCFAIRAVRWNWLSRSFGPATFGATYSATLSGFACTFLLGRAGEPIRPVLIGKKNSLSIPRMFGVYVLERVFDIAATAVIAGSALLLFQRQEIPGEAHVDIMNKARIAGGALMVGLVVMVSFLIYFRYHGAEWLARRLQKSSWRGGWRGKIIALLEGFSEGLQGIRTGGDLVVLIALTALHWALIVFCYLWIAHALGGKLLELDFAGAMLVLGFSAVGSAMQLPGVGGGAQVATFLVFTLVFGVEKVPAATASILIWLITFASCSLVGLPLLLAEGWSMGELRQMASGAARSAEIQLEADAERDAEIGVEKIAFKRMTKIKAKDDSEERPR
ncbi:MAG TPA: lysylphosphatidylglycerol synthase transmembrane domain-containing protein [Candidatus Acidoferrales bacterium]